MTYHYYGDKNADIVLIQPVGDHDMAEIENEVAEMAKRDSEWMGPLYMFHGLSVDCIDKHQPNSDARRKAYASSCVSTFSQNSSTCSASVIFT